MAPARLAPGTKGTKKASATCRKKRFFRTRSRGGMLSAISCVPDRGVQSLARNEDPWVWFIGSKNGASKYAHGRGFFHKSSPSARPVWLIILLTRRIGKQVAGESRCHAWPPWPVAPRGASVYRRDFSARRGEITRSLSSYSCSGSCSCSIPCRKTGAGPGAGPGPGAGLGCGQRLRSGGGQRARRCLSPAREDVNPRVVVPDHHDVVGR